MLKIEEVLRAGKGRIRRDQHLTDAFSFYFRQTFGREPDICCKFTDYNKLLNTTLIQENNMAGELKKYKVLYRSKKILTYSKNGKTHRRYAGRVDDAWLDEFFKHGGGKRLDDIDQKIIKLEAPKKKEAPAKAEKKEATKKAST